MKASQISGCIIISEIYIRTKMKRTIMRNTSLHRENVFDSQSGVFLRLSLRQCKRGISVRPHKVYHILHFNRRIQLYNSVCCNHLCDDFAIKSFCVEIITNYMYDQGFFKLIKSLNILKIFLVNKHIMVDLLNIINIRY